MSLPYEISNSWKNRACLFVQHGVPSARLKPDSWWEILVDAVVNSPMPQSGLPFRIKAHLPPANSSTGYADCS